MPSTVNNDAPGPSKSEEGRGAGHVRTDRDRPDRQLIPRQQVAGEREQQRQHQQDHADDPVEFARRLVAAGEEHAVHVQPRGDHHRMGPPAMQFAQNAQRRHVAQRGHVVVRPLQRRPVIEHQQHAGDRLDQEQEERDPAHAPGVAQRDPLLLDRHRVQVQEEVRQHHHDAIAAIDRRGMPEDALPDLRVANDISERSHRSVGRLSFRECFNGPRSRRVVTPRRSSPDPSTGPVPPGTSGSCRLPTGRRRRSGSRSVPAGAAPGLRS